MNKTTNMTRSSLCGLVCLSLLERRVDLPAGEGLDAGKGWVPPHGWQDTRSLPHHREIGCGRDDCGPLV